MDYTRDIIEIIGERHSSRTYLSKAIEKDKRDQLKLGMNKLKTEAFRFELIDYELEEGAKLGTYGMIKGAKAYMVGIMSASLSDNKKAALDFGYAFEQVVLKATDLGLQTCWMVATFNAKDIRKLLQMDDREKVVIVSPLGYEERPRPMEKFARFAAGSDQRKPWSALFFDGSLAVPLLKEDAGDYSQVLDLVRKAPSASNKQPWRIIKRAKNYDFFVGDSGYKEVKGQKISKSHNDMGIAKAHFELGAKRLKLKGHWEKKKDIWIKDLDYVCTWVME